MLLDDGTNIWFSPANFKAYCQVDIISWPFDNQTCSLYFGSLSKSSEELELNPVDNDDIASKYLVFIANGLLVHYPFFFLLLTFSVVIFIDINLRLKGCADAKHRSTFYIRLRNTAK